MKPEERGRYERQIEDSHSKLVEIGQRHLQLQALPIGNPDPVPKRHYTKKGPMARQTLGGSPQLRLRIEHS